MNMIKTDSFYDFLKSLVANEDGSFDYNITNRILNKYKKEIRLKDANNRHINIINLQQKEAA